ncbi:hypothetical protein E1258_00370 [Micromonospora sp. KC207]|nr:hypothetical protein [Micromonospora sp. KC207]TDC67379.1 hypothetical protein E1258_00370 [Micromonospora sp. KC207]
MIERGSGRTSGLTDWRLMDLLSMWACIQDHETAGHWKQVAGWRKVCDLAQAHLGRLEEYRRGLAEAWPPATNAAARAYLGELDDLIDKVQRTHDAAAANYDALAAATRAISSARTELKPLHDQYVEKLQQKRAYEATTADPKALMGSRLPDKPVTDADLERLNAQARNLMYGLSGELQQAQAMLRQPPPSPKAPRQPDNPDAYAGDAPIIPLIMPVPISSSSLTNSSRGETSKAPSPIPTPQGVGPVLGGANAPSHQAMPGGTSTASTGGSHNIGAPSSGPLTPIPPSRPGAFNNPPGQSVPPTRSIAGGASGSTVSNPNRPLPPNGLIGGVPGAGFGQPGGATSSRRINPVGGVIGGGGAGTSPTGAAGSRPGGGRSSLIGNVHGLAPTGGAPGFGATPTRHGSQEKREEGRHLWDPDHPWETINGVPPVVRPTDNDEPIDPGPAIGFDR